MSRTLDKSLWTLLGSRRIASAPVVVNGYVYVYVYVRAEDGRICTVEPSTGRTVWSAHLGAPVLPPDEQDVSMPLTGLAAGEGILAVSASDLLVA